MNMMNEVYITRLSKFLPNEGVSNDHMEDFLGMIDNEASKGKGLVLRNNGIKVRYYALDRQGRPTHSNTEITVEAIRGLFGNGFNLEDVDLLSCGTTSPDQLLPSHTSMVHGLLNCPPVEILSSSGACNAGIQAMKFAYLSVKCGSSDNAVCTGSERLSPFMLSKNFENETAKLKELKKNPIIAFEKDFLRWMLSDGAGAALLQNKPAENRISLRIEWMENKSFANELETCMYSGGEKTDNGDMTSWLDYEPNDWLERALFSFKQDVKLLSSNIVPKGTMFFKEVLDKHGYDLANVNFFLPHFSSEYFRPRIHEEMRKFGLEIPSEKWFTNLTRVGNVGSASVFLMLEELFNSGKLEKGMDVLLMVPESARFSYTYALLKVV